MGDLHDELHRAAGAAPALPDLGELHDRARARLRRRRSLMASSAVVAVLAMGGLAWAVSRTEAPRPRQQVTAGGGTVDPSTAVPTTYPGWASTTVTSQGGPSTTTTDTGTTTSTVVASDGSAGSSTSTSTTAASPPLVNPGGPVGPGGTTIGGTRTTGSYNGNEQYRINGTCPQITQHFVAVFTTETGPAWAYDAHLCGSTQGTTWYGTGTGTFTLPDGSTFSVSINETAPQPTTGVPYFVTITGGTGAYAGASGRCDMTVHITPKGFGSQDQDGTFSCDIAIRPATELPADL